MRQLFGQLQTPHLLLNIDFRRSILQAYNVLLYIGMIVVNSKIKKNLIRI